MLRERLRALLSWWVLRVASGCSGLKAIYKSSAMLRCDISLRTADRVGGALMRGKCTVPIIPPVRF